MVKNNPEPASSAPRKKIAIFASGQGSTMKAIVEACEESKLNAQVKLLVSNQKTSGAVLQAQSKDISVHIIETKPSDDPTLSEKILLEKLMNCEIEWILLLGYTRKISSTILSNFRDRVVNTHPSLLPKFGGKGFFGKKVHQAVLDSGESITGVTVHLVNEEYDSGKILSQVEVQVEINDSLGTLEQRVKQAEKKHLIGVLKKIW